MLKSELVKLIHARNGHLYSQDIDKFVNIVLDEIANALKDGGVSNSAASVPSPSNPEMGG